MVALRLIHSISLPCLLYGIESLNLTKSLLASSDHTWDKAFYNIFSTFDIKTIRQCQFFEGFMQMQHYYSVQDDVL